MGCPVSKYQKGKSISCHGENIKIKPSFQERPTRTFAVINDKRVTSKYEIQKLLGQGTFSNVFRVEDKISKLPYAIKVIEFHKSSYGEVDRKMFEAEKTILTSISHENIISVHEIIKTESCAYMIMELAIGGDLFEKIQILGHIDETETLRITRMLVSAVDHLHKNGVTHRDLKPENVLFYTPGANARIIIADFGLAANYGPNKVLNTFCGSFDYLSPEILLEQNYNNKVDIWSLGVIVYFMLAGYLPFSHRDATAMKEKIITEPHSYKGQVWKSISSSAKDFIDKTLVKNPAERCNATECLQHHWIEELPTVNEKRRKIIVSCKTTTASSKSIKHFSQSSRNKYVIKQNDALPYKSEANPFSRNKNFVPKCNTYENEQIYKSDPDKMSWRKIKKTRSSESSELQNAKHASQILSYDLNFKESDRTSTGRTSGERHSTETSDIGNQFEEELRQFRVLNFVAKNDISATLNEIQQNMNRRTTFGHIVLPPIANQQNNNRRFSCQDRIKNKTLDTSAVGTKNIINLFSVTQEKHQIPKSAWELPSQDNLKERGRRENLKYVLNLPDHDFDNYDQRMQKSRPHRNIKYRNHSKSGRRNQTLK